MSTSLLSPKSIIYGSGIFLFFSAMAMIQIPALAKSATQVGDELKGWSQIGETETSVTIHSQIVKCDSLFTIHLALANKLKKAQTAEFFVHVLQAKDSDQSFSKLIQYPVPAQGITKSTCKRSLDALLMTLPADYNPEQVIIRIIPK